jgi:hypothetical protein
LRLEGNDPLEYRAGYRRFGKTAAAVFSLKYFYCEDKKASSSEIL